MDKVYDLWLAERLINCKEDVRSICDNYASSYEVFAEDFENLKRNINVSDQCASMLSDKNLENANRMLAMCTRLNIATVTYNSEFYPELLKEIENPPFLLFVRGDVSLLKNKFCVSTVGTRKMSEYGKYYGFKLSYELASAGAVIVSGMAKGIDSVTHAGALAAGGKTIAVLGCGVDVVYPKEHNVLYKKIVEGGGAVISEFLPGSTPYPTNFPIRNRIICGISYSTIVVEAPKKSGALITAGEAIKEGRMVFALPGNINSSTAYGTNELIKGGARLIGRSEDVLNEYCRLSDIKIDHDRYRRAFPQKELCDITLRNLAVSATVYRDGDNRADSQDLSADRMSDIARSVYQSDASDKNAADSADFPFAVYQTKTAEPCDGKNNNETQKHQNASQPPVSLTGKENTCAHSAQENNLHTCGADRIDKNAHSGSDSERIIAECENFGFPITEETKKICELISEKKRVSIDLLCEEGCSAKESMQILTILVQLGMAKEAAGGIYIICDR